MVFSSAVFLFVFLPSVFLLYRILPGLKTRNALLTVFSLVFYAFGNLQYLPLLLISVLINYTGGLLAAGAGRQKAASDVTGGADQCFLHDRTGQRKAAGDVTGETDQNLPNDNTGQRKAAVAVTVVLNLALLGVFKYADFAVQTFNTLSGLSIPLPGITLPIGISFFTFQGMSYVIDVYREPETVSRSFPKVLLYISFFPQLVAGPIVKYKDVAAQIDDRTCTPDMTSEGIVRFIRGLSKKLLLADTVGLVTDTIFSMTASELDARLVWLGMICYFFQIYYDFSGYSDMAIGLGKMFGFTFRENFLHPYMSTSVSELWGRWHVSLSSWLRDYLYIPLGGNRKGKARTQLNRLCVFFCTGLWHGANWTFVLWGLWQVPCCALEEWLEEHHFSTPKPIGWCWTILMFLCSLVLFRADTLAQAGSMLTIMFTGFTGTALTAAVWERLVSPSLLAALLVSLVFAFPVREKVQSLAEQKGVRCFPVMIQAASVGLLILDILVLAATSFSPFIYFRF